MFPFWEVAVAPVLEAAEARRLVEVGALRGENTRLIIDRLGPQTELHVVDPLPDFDPAEHEREFAGQYVFHRDLSLNVLGDLPPMDAALIDGDHNWYTVYNELRLLREVARAHDAPLPLLLLHDVGWPYGHRDLYYDPSNIPEEFRRDWRRAGMEPGKVRLVPFGAGLNPTLANAKVEGGPRNGVRRGLDDFVAEHDRPMRVVVLPIYFGLAIAVEQERLDRQPALAAELDRLESPAGKDQLLRLAEEIRLEALIFQHKIFYDRETSLSRIARRYLGQVKERPAVASATRAGLDELEAQLDAVCRELVLGHVVALGVTRPGPATFAKAYLEAHELFGRHVHAVAADPDGGDLDDLRAGLEALDLADDRVHHTAAEAVVADPAGTLPERVALVLVDEGLADGAVVDLVLDRLAPSGRVAVSAGAAPEAVAAVAAWADRVGAGREDGADGATWYVAGSSNEAGDPVGAGPAGSSADHAEGF